ncbi:MAG: type 4a pilus biogenesis protein PilO [bacterium]|nr:type 4a pilus biogenesis protein PilO [bacterium]
MELKRWFTIHMGISGLLAITLVVFIMLLSSDMKNRSVSVRMKREELQSRSQALQTLVTLRKDADAAANITTFLQTALPSQEKLIDFPKFFESYAKNNSMEFGFTFDSETKSANNRPGANQFTMKSSGTYNQFIRFLKNIEQSQYFVKFKSINSTRKPGDEVFDITIKGEVFSQ